MNNSDDDNREDDMPYGAQERYDRYRRDLDVWRMRAKGSRRPIVWGAAALVAALVLFNTFYQVQPEEVGVVVRFGRYIRTSEPGLRVKVPFVEQVSRIPVQRQLKEEFGFRTADPAVRSRYSQADFNAEAVMLTGDLNVAVVEWIVQYRVADP